MAPPCRRQGHWVRRCSPGWQGSALGGWRGLAEPQPQPGAEQGGQRQGQGAAKEGGAPFGRTNSTPPPLRGLRDENANPLNLTTNRHFGHFLWGKFFAEIVKKMAPEEGENDLWNLAGGGGWTAPETMDGGG